MVFPLDHWGKYFSFLIQTFSERHQMKWGRILPEWDMPLPRGWWGSETDFPGGLWMPYPWNWQCWISVWVTSFDKSHSLPPCLFQIFRNDIFPLWSQRCIIFFSWGRLLQIIIPGSRDWSHNLAKETWGKKKRRWDIIWWGGDICQQGQMCYQDLQGLINI